jgi:CRP/FNR family cyclic AMP-dependent transcriptional regulator
VAGRSRIADIDPTGSSADGIAGRRRGAMGVTADAGSFWLVPAILAVLVFGAAWVGIRWYYSEYLSSLADVPLFASLGSGQLRAVARAAARRDIAPGVRVVTEGERGYGFYILEKGAATVSVRGEPKATLGPGGYFGEMAVIDRGVRSATVTADSPTTVLHLPSSAFRVLVERDRSIASAVEAELVRRLRESGAEVPDPDASDAGPGRLEALSRELRVVQRVDWGTGGNAPRRGWFRR